MKHTYLYLTATISIFFIFFSIGNAANINDHLSGKILLQVESKGEAWYVNPKDKKRHSLGSPEQAYQVMRAQGVGINNIDLIKIPIAMENYAGSDSDGDGLSDNFEKAIMTNPDVADSDGDSYNDFDEVKNGYSPYGPGRYPSDSAFAKKHSGKIFLQVQSNGEAWYINPNDFKRYYLGRAADAFAIMRKLGLGITNANLNKVAIAGNSNQVATSNNLPIKKVSDDQTRSYEKYKLQTGVGEFEVQVITLDKNAYTMVTDAMNFDTCTNNCPAQPLEKYVKNNLAQVGIHGSYFCPPDYPFCADKIYSYEGPFFNSNTGKTLNDHKLRFHSGPIMVLDDKGSYHYYNRTRVFGTVDEFSARTGTNVRAAISNYPSLLENGVNVVYNGETLDEKQKTLKGVRGAIGYNNSKVFLVIAKGATVYDMATIMQQIGATYALNLDGGGSSAMYYEDSYVIGPGRLLPNAILFKKK